MVLIGLVVAGVAVSAGLALQAFRENVLFFFSPTEVVAGDAPVERGFRLGGMVADGSVAREISVVVPGRDRLYLPTFGPGSRGLVSIPYPAAAPLTTP